MMIENVNTYPMINDINLLIFYCWLVKFNIKIPEQNLKQILQKKLETLSQPLLKNII